MKKMIDRRMVGFYISVGAICYLVGKLTDQPLLSAAVSVAITAICGLYATLVTGNVVQAFKKDGSNASSST